MRRRDVWRMLRRALVFARPYRAWLAGGASLTLTSGALGAIEPLLLKRIFDGLARGREALEPVAWQVLSGIVTIRSFAMEDAEKQRFLGQVRHANRLVARGVGFDSGVGAAQSLVVVLARVAALAYGGFLVVNGEVSLGTLVAFLGYVAGLFGPVQGLATVYRTLNTGAAAVAQVFAILDTQAHLGDAPDCP